MQLLWRRDFLDHDTDNGLPSGVSITSTFVSAALSNHQSNTYSSSANPLTISPDLTVFVYVGVLSAVICMDGIKALDGDGFGTFHAIEGEKPTLAATQAVSDPEITIKLDLQCRPIHLFDKDTILQEQNKSNRVLLLVKKYRMVRWLMVVKTKTATTTKENTKRDHPTLKQLSTFINP